MKPVSPLLAAFVLLLLLLGGYAGAYLGMGDKVEWIDTTTGQLDTVDRCYRWPWARVAFQPAAWLEGKLRGVKVETTNEPPALIAPG